MKNHLEKLKLGILEHKNKNYSAAEKIYLEILDDNSNHPDANHNLSILLIEQNKIDKAERYIINCIESEFAIAQYFLTASKFFSIKSDFKKALLMANKSIQVSKNDEKIKCFYQKATVLKALGDNDESLVYFKRCLDIDPKNPIVLNSYGVGLCQKEKFIESIPYFTTALEYKPDFFDSNINLGLAYQKTNKAVEALKFYEKAKSINPNHHMLNINIGSMYQQLRKPEKALYYYNIAQQIEPNFPEIYNNIGIVYGETGKKKKAYEFYRKALELDPNYTKAFRHIALTKLLKINDPIVGKMEHLYYSSNISETDKIEIAFGLGTIYEFNKQYKDAFRYFDEGNKLIRKNLNYDIERVIKNIKQMYNFFPSNLSIKKKSQFTPIFILGMPRSGSTLLENIITNHPEVESLGELSFISDLVTKTKKNNIFWPEIVNEFSEEDLLLLRDNYLNRIKEISPRLKNIFTDKMPYNFLYIGFIKKIFPDCKIIFTSRDSRDNCVSIYFLKLFGSHKYSHDLKDLAKYYNIHTETINFWKKIYPDQIFDFKYEEFVKNPKNETKKLFEYCNLKYEDGYERFDLNKNMIRTASSHQVRDRVNSSSIGKWKNYKNELKDLLNELNKDSFHNQKKGV